MIPCILLDPHSKLIWNIYIYIIYVCSAQEYCTARIRSRATTPRELVVENGTHFPRTSQMLNSHTETCKQIIIKTLRWMNKKTTTNEPIDGVAHFLAQLRSPCYFLHTAMVTSRFGFNLLAGCCARCLLFIFVTAAVPHFVAHLFP